ncbi:MAG TPA: ribulokinase [Polyangiaceae bacterium]|nr:ribulokinase [Polyangiaceae bacterium]
MASPAFVIGLDFGTDSVRSAVVDAYSGEVVGTAVEHYPRWRAGLYCDQNRNQFRQHPLDYLESMQASVRAALGQAGDAVARCVRGLAVDTTGSTPVLADESGQPLSLQPRFSENPNAMFVLWKDHTAVAEAEKINRIARSWGGADFTKYVGGVYSSEWFWAKALHILETDVEVASSAATILEHCDWVPAMLTGTALHRIKRSRCAAGHKALWHAEFGGYPSDSFLSLLHPRFPALKQTFGCETFTADTPVGPLSEVWAARLGLPRDTLVSVGAFDAHMGAVGAGIAPHRLVKVMGTSTCDIVLGPRAAQSERVVSGICGQVDGSVLPGLIGYEAGQSAFGDVYAWFKNLLAWPLETVLPKLNAAGASQLARAVADAILPALEESAAALPWEEAPLEEAPIALDWLNGRRTPDADQRLTGAISGLRLGSDAARIYRSLVEATAYGSRAIVERFRAQGVRIDSAIAMGGVASKSPFAMQTVADVMNLEVSVVAGDQPVALGAAMFAAAAAGIHPSVEAAQRAMSCGVERIYRPNPARGLHYDEGYKRYRVLGAFVERELPRRFEDTSGSASLRADRSHLQGFS